MYRKLLLIAPLFTIIVVVVGAYTRLTDSGLGCPDWPGCYGQLTAPDTAAEIARASERFPGAEIDPFKGWVEMIHRYLAMSLGLLILGIAVIAWRNRLRQAASAVRLPGSDAHWLGTGLLLLLLVQAMLGKFTVTLLLKPGVVTLHLLGGMLILSVLFRMAISEFVDRGRVAVERAARLVPWAAGGIVLLIGQIILGGWVSTNYAVLACTDFPQCQGSWWPEMRFDQGFQIWRALGMTPEGDPISFAALTAIHYTHRLMAVVVLLAMAWLVWRLRAVPPLARQGHWLGWLALVQLGSGLGNVILGWPLMAALLHTAGAAGMVMVLTWTVARTSRAAVAGIPRPVHAPTSGVSA
jgi:cytochrome c oxidase assembly protein subunit 15